MKQAYQRAEYSSVRRDGGRGITVSKRYYPWCRRCPPLPVPSARSTRYSEPIIVPKLKRPNAPTISHAELRQPLSGASKKRRLSVKLIVRGRYHTLATDGGNRWNPATYTIQLLLNLPDPSRSVAVTDRRNRRNLSRCNRHAAISV